jgi:hypothetical protein
MTYTGRSRKIETLPSAGWRCEIRCGVRSEPDEYTKVYMKGGGDGLKDSDTRETETFCNQRKSHRVGSWESTDTSEGGKYRFRFRVKVYLKQEATGCCLLPVGFLPGFLFDLADEMLHGNVGWIWADHTVMYQEIELSITFAVRTPDLTGPTDSPVKFHWGFPRVTYERASWWN